MMTWFTAMSIFDSAQNMELPQLALAHKEATSLFYELVLGYSDEDGDSPVGPAPTPLKLMWTGYETALAGYSIACACELVRHGVNTGIVSLEIANTLEDLRRHGDPAPMDIPPWLSDVDFLRSHRSNMMRRWPDVYEWNRTATNWPYLWPVVDGEGGYELRLSKFDKDLINKGERKLPASVMERVANA